MAKDLLRAMEPDDLAHKKTVDGGEWWAHAGAGTYTVEEYGWRTKAYLAVKSLGNPKVLDEAQFANAVTSYDLEETMSGDWIDLKAWNAVSAIGITNNLGGYEFYPVACEMNGCKIALPAEYGEITDLSDLEEGFAWDAIPKDALLLGSGDSFNAAGAKKVMILPIGW